MNPLLHAQREAPTPPRRSGLPSPSPPQAVYPACTRVHRGGWGLQRRPPEGPCVVAQPAELRIGGRGASSLPGLDGFAPYPGAAAPSAACQGGARSQGSNRRRPCLLEGMGLDVGLDMGSDLALRAALQQGIGRGNPGSGAGRGGRELHSSDAGREGRGKGWSGGKRGGSSGAETGGNYGTRPRDTSRPAKRPRGMLV